MSQAAKPMPIGEVLDVLAINFNSALVVDDSKSREKYRLHNRYGNLPSKVAQKLGQSPKEEPKQADPTPLDWEEIIIPALRKFLASENHMFYEIEEWVRRIRAQMSMGNDRTLRFVSREVLGGTRPPKEISIFFPPHLRKIQYGYRPEYVSLPLPPPPPPPHPPLYSLLTLKSKGRKKKRTSHQAAPERPPNGSRQSWSC